MLEITAEEERKMSTLISSEEKARRRTEKRRQAGAMRREDYRGRAAWRRAEARRMYGQEKVSIPEIAKALGVSVRSVNGYVFR